MDTLLKKGDMMYCSKCGGENGDRAKFCQSCGEGLQKTPLQSTDPVALASTKSHNTAKYIYMTVVVGLIGSTTVFGGWLWLEKKMLQRVEVAYAVG